MYYRTKASNGGKTKIELKDFPVLSVSSIKQGSAESIYTQSEGYIFEKNTVLLSGSAGGGKGYEQNKVTYVAGYVTYDQNASGGDYEGEGITFPDSLLEACLTLVVGMYNKRKNIGVKTFTVQGKSVTFKDEEERDDFERIIRKFRKPTVDEAVAI